MSGFLVGGLRSISPMAYNHGSPHKQLAQALIAGALVWSAIPGEVPLSGACGGIQLLGLEDRQIRQEWRSSSGVWSNRVGKGCRIFASHAAPNAFFQHFGAYIERNVAAGHEKTARCCAENGLKELSPDGVMRRRELASPWPSRRGWLPEVAAWIRRGNDGSGNVGGPTTIVG